MKHLHQLRLFCRHHSNDSVKALLARYDAGERDPELGLELADAGDHFGAGSTAEDLEEAPTDEAALRECAEWLRVRLHHDRLNS